MNSDFKITLKNGHAITIAFDLDGVVIDFVQAFLNLVEKEKGRSYSKKDVTKYALYDILDITYDEYRNYTDQIITNIKSSSEPPPIPGAVKFFQKYSAYCEKFLFITARSVYAKEATEDWLKRHLNVDFEILFSYIKNKHDIARLYNIDYLVDDNEVTIRTARDAGFTGGILFKQLWNNSVPGAFNVSNWKELEALIEKLACTSTNCGG